MPAKLMNSALKVAKSNPPADRWNPDFWNRSELADKFPTADKEKDAFEFLLHNRMKPWQIPTREVTQELRLEQKGAASEGLQQLYQQLNAAAGK